MRRRDGLDGEASSGGGVKAAGRRRGRAAAVDNQLHLLYDASTQQVWYLGRIRHGFVWRAVLRQSVPGRHGSSGVASLHFGSVSRRSQHASAPEQDKPNEAGHLARSFKIMDAKHFFGWAAGCHCASLARVASWSGGKARTGRGSRPPLGLAGHWPIWHTPCGISDTMGEPLRLGPNRGRLLRAAQAVRDLPHKLTSEGVTNA